MRELFVAVGGQPDRRAPHYFCLGSSPWFEGLAGYPAASEPHQQVVYPVSRLGEVVGLFGMPASSQGSDYQGFENGLVDTFIEVQVWADDPVLHLLADGR